jgi:hypothetical protein
MTVGILSFAVAAAPPSNIWMAAPDIVAFTVDDPPIIPGNIETGSFSGNAYGTWFQRNNPASGGALEWCTPFGITRDRVRYSDKPNPLPYRNKIALRTLANYTVTGATATAVYYRDEANGQGDQVTSPTGSFSFMITQRHTIYIKLSAAPTNNAVITISNSQANTFPIFNFTYNDKITRAGGIQVNQIGQRPNDALRYAYLAARIPGAPNSGTVNFATTYGMTSFQILNSAKATVYTGSIVQRVSSAATTGEGYDSGIDVADIGHGFSVTGISKAASAVVTCPGHDFLVGDKVRLAGINGMTQINNDGFEAMPSGAAGHWVAPTVTAKDATTITINVNSTGFSTFASTTAFSTALGGVNNKVFKCFNTNRAGTYVYGLDFSGWTPGSSGTHYIYIPGYGVSDPFLIQSDAWAIAAGKTHQGIFNMRLGCAVSSEGGYSRGVAIADGVNGCTNYRSNLVALFCSECAQSYAPTGTNLITAGMGAYVDAGTLVLSSLTCPAGTVFATTTVPHGITVGTDFAIQPSGFSPPLYNYIEGGNYTAGIARSTGASTFTWNMAGQVLAAGDVSTGIVRTGFVTSTRTGTKAAVQDAGDNDDVGYDHIPGYKLLALVFRNIPKPSRFTPYTVPLSTSLLNSTLYAGTDALPPLFHELFWYADQYRQGQMPDGSVWGGTEYGKFGSMVPDFPEPIDRYRGTDAGGSLTGQTVMGFAFARDHLTTFMYAGLAAQLAQIAYDYSLTTLGDTWKASAIAAYTWADGLATSVTTRDAYYVTTLNIKTKMGWNTTQYNEAILVLSDRALLAKVDAAGSLYRLLGSTAGQAPYGNFIEKNIMILPTIVNGGSGHAVNDIIAMAGGTGVDVAARVLVTAVSGGVITAVREVHKGQYTTVPANPVLQGSTTGAGTGAQFSFISGGCWSAYYTQNMIGIYDYCATSPSNSNKLFMLGDYDHSNAAIGLNPSTSYMGMQFDVAPVTQSIAAMSLAAPIKEIQAHLMYVLGGGATPIASKHLKLMQAGCSFQLGANLPGKAFQTGTGPRPFVCTLHEDAYKMGTPTPYGIVPYGYQGWGSAFRFFNFAGIGNVGGDGPTNYLADNTSGAWENTSTPGSAKMWNPWRYGSSFWEWSPENRTIIYISEWDLTGSQLNTIAAQLYLHGWDGNV